MKVEWRASAEFTIAIDSEQTIEHASHLGRTEKNGMYFTCARLQPYACSHSYGFWRKIEFTTYSIKLIILLSIFFANGTPYNFVIHGEIHFMQFC